VKRAECVAFVFLATVGALEAQTPRIDGLDHVNIAVADLEAAAARYRDLGFSLKPGTPHANGIRNQHAKFPDGTELELITAPAATDALTATYRKHLAQGDAPAFFALFGPRSAEASARLWELNLTYMFYGGRNQSPTDRPEHFAHANTAESLVAVWLAGTDLGAERQLLQSGGATLVEEQVHAPALSTATVARVPGGEVLLLSSASARQVFPGRKIIGVTLRVRRLDAARRILAKSLAQDLPVVRHAKGISVFLSPQRTHGIWLEFRQTV
jgi:catechol 2,3-dioxygenase-like lactoylglutathione lyase family enzyme